MLSRSDSERQRNLMIHDQYPLPVYFSQIIYVYMYVQNYASFRKRHMNGLNMGGIYSGNKS